MKHNKQIIWRKKEEKSRKLRSFFVVGFVILFLAISVIGCSDLLTTIDNDINSDISNSSERNKLNDNISEGAEEEPVAGSAEGSKYTKPLFDGYTLIQVDGGDLSGSREPKVVVDIGFGDREYWAFTNEHGQLVRVIADEITLQDEENESVTSKGRYYPDEAKVPGTESSRLDEGHVIADSLGGVANAYNITPQNSTLNRHGDQAYMEKIIRDAISSGKKVTHFECIITYADTETQTPSHYKYSYRIDGDLIVDEFDNVNPDDDVTSGGEDSNMSEKAEEKNTSDEEDISSIDKNGNGVVTIAEAKAAGFTMPITSDHWLYKYMIDRDGDGMVGE